MKRWVCILWVLVCAMPDPGIAQEVEYTKRARNEVREGPGNYYPLLYILPDGTPIEIIKTDKGWIRFRNVNRRIIEELPEDVGDLENWISKNSLVEKAPRKPLEELQLLGGSLVASPSSVAAAIRGYALRYGKINPNTVDSLMSFLGPFFTPEEYAAFKQQTPLTPAESAEKLVSRHRKFFREHTVSVAEEGVGMGIAARIAARGLVQDPELLKYVNMLGTLLVEATPAYDVPFRVLVLQDAGLNAYSVPGGYVFISEDILRLCQDEAELAAIIAHEMMHVLLRHGVEEMEERKLAIKMDAAMHELQQELGEEYSELDAELEDFAISAYETVVKPRLQSYEFEADEGAAVLLARVGYDPTAVARMALRIRDAVRQKPDLEMESPFLSVDFQRRHNHIAAFLDEELSGIRGQRNQPRFARYARK